MRLNVAQNAAATANALAPAVEGQPAWWPDKQQRPVPPARADAAAPDAPAPSSIMTEAPPPLCVDPGATADAAVDAAAPISPAVSAPIDPADPATPTSLSSTADLARD